MGWLGVVEWIQLAQDKGRWRALMNTVINLRVMEPRTRFCWGSNLDRPKTVARLLLTELSGLLEEVFTRIKLAIN
jgi:hypothetical protein